jgi:methyl-accepting chemotaxis protein
MVGLIPLAITAYTASDESKQALQSQTFAQLEGIRENKKNQILDYFSNRQHDIEDLKTTISRITEETFDRIEVINTFKKNTIENYFNRTYQAVIDVQSNIRYTVGLPLFTQAFKSGLNSSDYKKLLKQYEAGFQAYQKSWGFYDILLIDTDGNVVYSLEKEADLGENVKTGSLKNSGLAAVYKNTRNQIAIEDYSYYEPSKEQTAFIGTPLKDKQGRYISTVVFQMPAHITNDIVQNRIGLPSLAESYLVGKSEGKTFLRSDRVIKKGVIGKSKTGRDVDFIFNGQSGKEFKLGSSGRLELSFYLPIKIKGLNWGIITSVDVEEILAKKIQGQANDFFQDYIQSKGYYDLFLVEPNGFVFYSANH